MAPIITTILTFLSPVGRLVGKTFQEWSEWAVANPRAAALQLQLLAARAQGRSMAFRNQQGWRARKNRRLAESLKAQAAEILRAEKIREDEDRARGGDALRSACSVEPGTWRVRP